nr:MAG TPA: hypothetical protein [Caudoviricetes sp.]
MLSRKPFQLIRQELISSWSRMSTKVAFRQKLDQTSLLI